MMLDKETQRLRSKRFREKDPVAYRAYHRNWEQQRSAESKARKLDSNRARLGFPPPTRPCPSLCECCGNAPTGRGALHLDHDHVTGKFRGWLCSKCNMGIGQLGDNESGLMKALNYLQVTNVNPTIC